MLTQYIVIFQDNEQKYNKMFNKLLKNSQKKPNNRLDVHKLTVCLEFRRNVKIFFCVIAQNNQKKYVIFAKKRKKCEFTIDILKKTLYNGYNHRNGVMGRSVYFFRSALFLPRKRYTS